MGRDDEKPSCGYPKYVLDQGGYSGYRCRDIVVDGT